MICDNKDWCIIMDAVFCPLLKNLKATVPENSWLFPSFVADALIWLSLNYSLFKHII